jgi:epoxyqueuosine reductase QueG
MVQANGADQQLTDEVRDYLLAEGADLVGFGSVSLMEGAPDIMRPERYLPDARTMISIALAVNQASCDLIARSVREHGVP